MRTIKFRAWDRKEMQYQFRVLSTTGGISTFSPVGDHFDNVERDWELMQFTGLLDKNGKEIYEGDVIERWGCDHTEHDDSCTVEFYEIAFSDEMGAFTFKENGYNYFINPQRNKIIGNIYENPELIKSV